MPAGDADETVRKLAGQRLRLIDPLLPEHAEEPVGCDARFTVPGPDGKPIATGRCEHRTSEPGSLDLAWGAATRRRLIPAIAGPEVAGSLGALIAQWSEHLAGVPGSDEPDTAAVIDWPSRDIEGVTTLLDHGLWPMTVLAARVTSHHRASEPAADKADDRASRAGVMIRRAGPADVAAVAGLGVREIRFDAHFGCVIERPDALEAMRRYAAGQLAAPEPWTWLAERDGEPIGMLLAEPPATATWIAPLTAQSPVAYLMSMFVVPGERGSGTGAALTGHFHRAVAAAGVRVALLHYELFNPLSVPFWSQQGYRPLWTSFETRQTTPPGRPHPTRLP